METEIVNGTKQIKVEEFNGKKYVQLTTGTLCLMLDSIGGGFGTTKGPAPEKGTKLDEKMITFAIGLNSLMENPTEVFMKEIAKAYNLRTAPMDMKKLTTKIEETIHEILGIKGFCVDKSKLSEAELKLLEEIMQKHKKEDK